MTTRNLRAAALGFGLPFILALPTPDGSISIANCAALAHAYQTELVAPEVVVVPDTMPLEIGGWEPIPARPVRPRRPPVPVQAVGRFEASSTFAGRAVVVPYTDDAEALELLGIYDEFLAAAIAESEVQS